MSEWRKVESFHVDSFLHGLQAATSASQSVRAIHTIAAKEAVYGEFGHRLHPQVEKALQRRGIQRPYRHQQQAWDILGDGDDLVVVTPTASGKTLCYNAPILSMLCQDPDGSALMLYPTKALAQDQAAALNELLSAAELSEQANVYDGDTPQDIRRRIRDQSRLVMTNPDMLHQAILPHHARWRRFLSTLRYVVVDEAHMYRGVFGSHVANVLRRLMRICRHYGSSPQFVFTTATIANPQELAQRLSGRQPRAVLESGAPSGEKKLVFFNPPLWNMELRLRRTAENQANRILRRILPDGAAAITFCRSRNGVETLTRKLREGLQDRGHASIARKVEGYRAGYLPEERRRIERGLRAGDIQAVITTNALELGVDIGALDVCLLAGYPGTIASTWQQAGRAGRRQQAALVLLIASDAPVDQYIVNHPEFFIEASPEHALIDPNNLRILAEHLKCAVFELPLRADEAFGDLSLEDTQDVAEWLSDETGHFHDVKGVWRWSSDNYPATTVNIRDALDENFVIINTGDPRGDVIGEIDFFAAHKTVYEKAIYSHGGELFEVHRLDYEDRKAYIRPVTPDYYTTAIDQTRVFLLDDFEHNDVGAVRAGWGEVRVATRFVGYKKIRFKTGENIGYGEILLPDIEKHTTSWWLTFPSEWIAGLGLGAVATEYALSGLSEVLHTVSVVHAMCDARDLGAVVGAGDGEAWIRHADLEMLEALAVPTPLVAAGADHDPTIFIFDQYPGGTGLSEKLFAHSDRLLEDAKRLIERCPCARGCPACVGPTEPDSAVDTKAATRFMLEQALASAR